MYVMSVDMQRAEKRARDRRAERRRRPAAPRAVARPGTPIHIS